MKAATTLSDFERAYKHPMFLSIFATEFARKLTHLSLDEAFDSARCEAVDGCADADPADMEMTDEEFESASWRALNGAT